MSEVWKPITETCRHEVSNFGRVRLLSGEVLKSRFDSDGYKIISAWAGSGYVTLKVHRLVAEAFLGKIEGLDEVDHINGVRCDNRWTNLRWADSTMNKINRHVCRGLSGVMGVRYRDGKKNPWQAYAVTGGRFRSLGHFATAAEAATARRQFGRKA